MFFKRTYFEYILVLIFLVFGSRKVELSPLLLGFSFPASGSNFIYPNNVPARLNVNSSSSSINNATTEFNCLSNSFQTYFNNSIFLSTSSTAQLSYPNTAFGNCSLLVTSAPPNVVTPYPFVNFTIQSNVTVNAPSTLTVAVPTTVYVNSSNPTGDLDSFTLTLLCSGTSSVSQVFHGNYNVPLSITPASNMTAKTGCSLSVPSNGIYSSASKTSITVLGSITISSVPNPVSAGNNLAIQLTKSNSAPIATITTLSCNSGNQSVSSSSASFTLLVPSYFYGNCSLSTIQSGTVLYVQIEPAFVTVNGNLTWITPTVNSYLIAGESQLMLVDSTSSASASIQIILGDSTELGSATTNVSQSLSTPANFPRGQTTLSAQTSQLYFNSPSNVTVFVNTTVGILSPSSGVANEPIFIQLIANDGGIASGEVQMICSDGATSTQAVSSNSPTSFFTASRLGKCTFTIITLDSLFTSISSSSGSVTLFIGFSPTGGPLVFLDNEQISEFLATVTIPFSRIKHYLNHESIKNKFEYESQSESVYTHKTTNGKTILKFLKPGKRRLPENESVNR